MEKAEIWDRSRQTVAHRWDVALGRLGHQWPADLRTVAPSRQGRFFFEPETVPQLVALVKERLPEQADEIVSRAEHALQHRFDLLGFKNVDYGPVIDWHLDKIHQKQAPRQPAFRVKYLDFAAVGDSKVTWELNRHQHLVTLAKAYLLTGDERFVQELVAQWYSWREQNPYPIGINWASSLEVGFRSLSWLWVRALLEGDSKVPPQFRQDLLQALALSGRYIERYLSTYFSPNTHLLGEAAALFFIGTLCPEIAQADHWQKLGWRVVVQEAQKQVRDDGFYFEQSAYYHVYALELWLQCALLAAKNDITPSPEYSATVERMCSALALLSRTGITAVFGDDDGGRLFDGQRNHAEHLVDPLATAAAVFGRGDFKFLANGLREDAIWLLGAEGVEQFDALKAKPPAYASTALRASGLYLMSSLTSSADPIPMQLLADAGPQGAGSAGHGHADALSVQLSMGGRVLLQDPGALEYVGNTGDRDAFRGTSAHNTLTVDDRGQSSPRGPFAWDRQTKSQAEVWVAGELFTLFCGSHDGYAELGIKHRRWIFHLHGHFWLIRDVVEGQGSHKLELAWHLGAEMVPSNRQDRFFADAAPDCGIELVTCPSDTWRRELLPDGWSPAYGRKENSWTVRYSTDAELPAECATVLLPLLDRNQSGGKLSSLNEIQCGEARGYIYEVGQDVHSFFFRQTSGPWMHANWASDAEFVYSRANSRRLCDLYFYNGSYVEAGGKRVVSAVNTVPYCQLIARGDKTQVVSPASDRIVVHQPLGETAIGQDAGPVFSGVRDRREI